jgi:uncharacterized membrane protein required for colicin V production
MEITLIDAVLLAVIVVGGVWGLTAGAVRVVVPFTMILAVTALIHSYPDISSRFGKAPYPQFFLLLLLVLIGVLVFGFVLRALQAAVHASGYGAANRLVGFGLGLVTGTLLAGALVWWLQTYGGPQGKSLLGESVLAPAVLEFFQMAMAFLQRLIPERPKEPWWKRTLW